MSWKIKKLGNILSISTGKYDVNHSVMDGQYPFYTCAMLPFKSNTFSFDDEVILLPGNGANVGEVMYFKGKFEAYQRTYVLHKINANVKYLFYYMKGYWKNAILNNQYGSATNYIRLDNITDLQIPLPPLPIQKRIAEILDTADALRRKDQELLRKYDELAQAIFIDMFGDPVKNEKGWEVKTVRRIAEKISDGPFGSNLKTEHYSKDGIRVIRLKNIGVNTFHDSDAAYISFEHYEKVLKKHTCLPGDIIIGTLGEPNLRACIFPPKLEKAVNKADCIMLRINSEVCNQEYISFLLNIPSFVESVANHLHGQTRSRISMGQVANLIIPIPPISLQNDFAKLIELLNLQRMNGMEGANYSQFLFDSLLQQAFKGELVK